MVSSLHRYRRLWKVFKVLSKYGLSDELASYGIGREVHFFQRFFPRRITREIKKYTRWERIRFAVEELGTTYIKFAQILSIRPDLVPQELIDEFEKLQSNVPPFEASVAKKIIEQELNRPVSEVFIDFEPKPFASASIAQVHKAKLHDGTPVVLKVQRPDVMQDIHTDVEMMKLLAKMYMDRYEGETGVNAMEVVENFEQSLKKEFSFLNEAANQIRFQNNFKEIEYIKVPEVFLEFSTEKLLVMEYIDGIKPTDLDKYKDIGCDPKIVAQRGMNAVFMQIFKHGYFHGDPHPGNMFLLPDNNICFIDFGMMGTVLKSDIHSFGDILLGVINDNPSKVKKGIHNLMVGNYFVNERKLMIELNDLIFIFNQMDPDKIDLQVFFERIKKLFVDQKIVMPGDFFILSKAMITIEGVGRKIDPQINVLEEITPHIKQMYREQFNPKSIFSRIIMNASDIMEAIETIPGDTKEVIQNVKAITAKHEQIGKELEKVARDFRKSSKRISNSVIMGVFLVASALLANSGMKPMVAGMPLSAWIGFGIATYLGLKLYFTRD